MASPDEKPLSASNSKIELKLLINKKEEKVLYAEADKEFVDFLFSLMSLPLGMVIKLLANKKVVGSIADLYNSIRTLNRTYVQSSEDLDRILNPKPPLLSFQSPLLLTNTDSVKKNKARAHICPKSKLSILVADDPNTLCPYCKTKMTSEVQFVGKDCSGADQKGTSSGLGFVKEIVTYMVTDNLEVKPLSTISSLALLNSSNIQDLSSLQEMVVHVGAAEGLKLLEESLQSKNVLTSVFLAKRSKRRI